MTRCVMLALALWLGSIELQGQASSEQLREKEAGAKGEDAWVHALGQGVLDERIDAAMRLERFE